LIAEERDVVVDFWVMLEVIPVVKPLSGHDFVYESKALKGLLGYGLYRYI